jgi:hypothetical protein
MTASSCDSLSSQTENNALLSYGLLVYFPVVPAHSFLHLPGISRCPAGGACALEQAGHVP